MADRFRPDPSPEHWPYRSDPPARYFGSYERYQLRGGRISSRG